MAIYHLTAKPVSRNKGQSVVAAAAYRAGIKLYDERLGKSHDYRNKRDVMHTEFSAPSTMAPWLHDILTMDNVNSRERFWNHIEHIENRHDAQLAREIEFALPLELTLEQNTLLAREFIEAAFVREGMIADWSIHWKAGNPHVHVLLTLRVLTSAGFGHKERRWNRTSQLKTWRWQWAYYANLFLARDGHTAHIDERSYQAQGIQKIPHLHLGKAVIEMQKRGIEMNILKEMQEAKNAIQVKPTWRTRLRAVFQFSVNKTTLHQITDKLTEHDNLFTPQHLEKTVKAHTASHAQAQKTLQKLKRTSLMSVDDQFTTHAMVDAEKRLCDLAHMLHNHQQSIKQATLPSSMKFTDEEHTALNHLTNQRSLVGLVGWAGTGKSHLLRQAKKRWEQQGLQVFGTAISGIAAQGLQQSSDIPSCTLASLLYALNTGKKRLMKSDVMVMDEAGMVDTRQLLELMEYIYRAKAKLVLVGDGNQLPPINAGTPFKQLANDYHFPMLTTIHRQRAPWQREATKALAMGNVEHALELYRDYVHTSTDIKTVQQQLIDHWYPTQQLYSTLILTHRKDDARRLNELARIKRLLHGEINEGHIVQTSTGTINVSPHERILLLKNDAKLNVKNGQFATIKNVKRNWRGQVTALRLQLDGNTPRHITLDVHAYSSFTYGYAATIHKAQGTTIDRTFLYLPEGKRWSHALLYVAMSRHRKQLDLYMPLAVSLALPLNQPMPVAGAHRKQAKVKVHCHSPRQIAAHQRTDDELLQR